MASTFSRVTMRTPNSPDRQQCTCCKLNIPVTEINPNDKCDECDAKEQATMRNIKVEVNYYKQTKKFAAMVLYTNADNESASICYYPSNKREARKLLLALELQYKVEGVKNGWQ